MISLATARRLRQAGLEWAPALYDFFVIPDHGLDDRVFVIAEMPVGIAQLHGQAVFTFQGAVEWALDFVVTTEAIWLPSESQLRLALESRLPDSPLTLMVSPDGYTCAIAHAGQALTFAATSAEEAYAAALLHILQAGPAA